MDKTSLRKTDSSLGVTPAGSASAKSAGTHQRQFYRASSRVFCLNGEWFFQTRDQDHGPFTCQQAAETGLTRYLEAKVASQCSVTN